MIVTKYKETFNRAFKPVALLFIKLGFTPNRITLLGLALGVGACMYLVLTRNIVVFCWLAFFFGLLDGVDGAVARVSGRISRFGSYLDAMCDRYYESLVVLAAAYVTGYWVLSLLVVIGIFNVSYAKARAAMEAPIRNDEWPDFMERTERDIIFIVGLLLSQIFRVTFLGRDIFWWTLLFLVIAVHVTLIQRMLRAKRLIESRSN